MYMCMYVNITVVLNDWDHCYRPSYMYVHVLHVLHVFSVTCTRLDTVRHQRGIMQQELKKTTLKTLTAEEKAHTLDQLLAEEETMIASIEKEISVAQEKLFKITQESKEAKRLQTNREAEIQV